MEMSKLIEMLTAAGIPFEVNEIQNTRQVCYPNIKNKICDAICFPGSYGYEDGLLEIMGLVDSEAVGDDVEGWLTAEKVFKRINAHYNRRERKMVYTYDSTTDCYTEECNSNMDYIIRNLPGVKVTAEENGLVQVEADKRAAEILDFLDDCDMIWSYKGKTIAEVKNMMNI